MYDYEKYDGLSEVLRHMGSRIYPTEICGKFGNEPEFINGIQCNEIMGDGGMWLVLLEGIAPGGTAIYETVVPLDGFWLSYRLKP